MRYPPTTSARFPARAVTVDHDGLVNREGRTEVLENVRPKSWSIQHEDYLMMWILTFSDPKSSSSVR